MIKTDNLNIESQVPLTSPADIRRELPVSDSSAKAVLDGRNAIQNILNRQDKRHMVILGPCSIHDREETLDYARKIKELSDQVSDRLVLVMRAYFEKPRTILGWKGLIYDPDLDDSGHIEEGLRLARQILLDITNLGLPTATELLEPIIPQYITDLICWAAIGARTAESQTHRQMASGLSMPIGIKNATDGSMQVAIQAIKAAASPHCFLGITENGLVGKFQTRGNAYGHLVLRGGQLGPNYGSEHIAFAKEVLRKSDLTPNIVVDCSHANSGKVPERQVDVMRDVLHQLQNGNRDIVGTMLESYLQTGQQTITQKRCDLKPGLSITDACLGWEQTQTIIQEFYKGLPNP